MKWREVNFREAGVPAFVAHDQAAFQFQDLICVSAKTHVYGPSVAAFLTEPKV